MTQNISNSIIKNTKYRLFTLIFVLLSLFLSGCGDSSFSKIKDNITINDSNVHTMLTDPNEDKQIVVLDIGYIIDLNVSDGDTNLTDIGYSKDDNTSGIAKYDENTSTYNFKNSVSYPLTLVGGTIKDINKSNKITMKTSVGRVISPLTTLIYKNNEILPSLSNVLKVSSDTINYSKDYIKENDLNFAKVSLMSYIPLKDNNLKKTFVQNLKENTAKFYDLNSFAIRLIEDINKTSSINYIDKYYYIKYIYMLESYSDNVQNMAKNLEYIRVLIDINTKEIYKDFNNKRYILTTNQSLCYDSANPSVQIACSDVNAIGDANISYGLANDYNTTTDIIVDNASHLIWQNSDDNNDTNLIKNYTDANTYCNDLNISGISTWRLPTIDELMSITSKDNQASDNHINGIFTNNINSGYWSSSKYMDPNIYANNWILYFNNGYIAHSNQSAYHYVRCVSNK